MSRRADPAARLPILAAAQHAADQLAMAALPLTAVMALGAGPELVGSLLAAQAAAWLFFSLPAGSLVDHATRPGLLRLAGLLAAIGAGLASLAASRGLAAGLGLGAFVSACGTVLFVLTAGAVVADSVPPAGLARANGRLELARAGASLLAPPVAGWLAAHGLPAAAYALALAAALLAWRLASLRPQGRAPAVRPCPGLRELLTQGAGFVLRHPLLRAIGGCALFWNFSFYALLVVLVPFALEHLALDPARLGLAQAGYGAGAIAGAALADAVQRRCGPNVVLLAGPGLSAAAPALLLAAPHGGAVLPFLAMFLVGFGPIMWLVCQTGIRQLVTPPHLLGRVGAALQVAIYGVRPAGALAGGALAAAWGAPAGLLLAGMGFLAAFLVVAASALARLRRLPA